MYNRKKRNEGFFVKRFLTGFRTATAFFHYNSILKPPPKKNVLAKKVLKIQKLQNVFVHVLVLNQK